MRNEVARQSKTDSPLYFNLVSSAAGVLKQLNRFDEYDPKSHQGIKLTFFSFGTKIRRAERMAIHHDLI